MNPYIYFLYIQIVSSDGSSNDQWIFTTPSIACAAEASSCCFLEPKPNQCGFRWLMSLDFRDETMQRMCIFEFLKLISQLARRDNSEKQWSNRNRMERYPKRMNMQHV